MPLNTVNVNNLVSMLKQQQGGPNYYIITGPELQFHKEAQEIISKVAFDEKFYGCTEEYFYVDDELDIDDILDNANMLSLFGDKRFYKLCFNGKPRADLMSRLVKMIRANDTVHVYMMAFEGVAERDLRSSAFYKELEKTNHYAISCNKLNAAEYRSWIRQRLRAMKFQFDEAVVNDLAERFENNLTSLQQILIQFQLRDIETLTVELIDQASESFADFSALDLIIALFEGNITKSNEILDHLVNHRNESPIAVIALLRRELQLLYDLRVNNTQLGDAHFILQPLAFQGISEGMHQTLRQNYWDRRKRALVEQAIKTRFSRYHLYRLLAHLADIEIVSKSRDNTAKVVAHLKRFFLMFLGIMPLGNSDLFFDEITL